MGLSAGYAPLALGTDSCGSLMTPATRASLYAIRPTIGLVSLNGVIPISKAFDTVGPMAKCVKDLANLLDVLVGPGTVIGRDCNSYANTLPGSWRDLRIGVLDPEEWNFEKQLPRSIPEAKAQIVRLLDTTCIPKFDFSRFGNAALPTIK